MTDDPELQADSFRDLEFDAEDAAAFEGQVLRVAKAYPPKGESSE